MEGVTGSIYQAATSMNLEMKRQETIARNLAASCNPGFKKEFLVSGTSFKNALDKSFKTNNKNVNEPAAGKVKVDFTQGNLNGTGRTLDFAIHGDGFFEVKTKDNATQYTRNGAFFVSKEGKLMTQEGHLLKADIGDLKFDTRDDINTLKVTEDGMLQVRGGVETNFKLKNLGRIKIVDIEDKNKLQRMSANYFTLADEDKTYMKLVEPGKYKLQNSYLEMSNSTPIADMTAMIQSQRDFDMGQKLIKTLDEISQTELRKLL
jgi:flagellar basal body rod protein FlgG